MSVKITYFVHGTTTDNENDLATGWAPGELSELGIEQAKRLGDLTIDKNFDVVISSDLKRAVDTANLAFGDKYKIIHDKRLRETNYGDLTEGPGNKIIKNNHISAPFPNGESYKDVEKRIADFCNYLKNNFNNKHVALVAHCAPQLALDVVLKGKTWKQAIEEDWRNTKSWQPGWEYEI